MPSGTIVTGQSDVQLQTDTAPDGASKIIIGGVLPYGPDGKVIGTAGAQWQAMPTSGGSLTTAFTPINGVSQLANSNFGTFTAASTSICSLMVLVSATSNFKFVSSGIVGGLNGSQLTANQWYGFQVLIVSGQQYSFQVDVACSVTLIAVYNVTS